MEPKDTRFELRLPAELNAGIDDWRRRQPDLPNRSDAIRRLLRLALETEQRQPLGKGRKAAKE